MKRCWYTFAASVVIVYGLPQDFQPIRKDPLIQKIQYNPNNGYEPYWVDGEWYIRNPSDWGSSTLTPTTTVPLVCGDECPHLFTSIQHVCARENTIPRNELGSCPECGYYETMMKPNIRMYHKTFDTYCKFLDYTCSKADDGNTYDLVHVGKCADDMAQIYKPMSEKKDFLQRLSGYLAHLNTTTTLKYDQLQKFSR